MHTNTQIHGDEHRKKKQLSAKSETKSQHDRHDGVERPLLGLVHPPFVPAPFSGPWTNQSAENGETAERHDNHREGGEAEIWRHAVNESEGSKPGEGQQPNERNAHVSDHDPAPIPQTQVGDWMNHSQVALHTGEDVKRDLSISGGTAEVKTNR